MICSINYRALLAVLLLALCLLFSGCGRSVNLYPLAQDHIVRLDKGQTFTAPRDGYFLSDDYLKKVLKAKVQDF